MTDQITAPAAPEAGQQTAPVTPAPERFRDDQGRFVSASDEPAKDATAAPVETAPAEGAQPQTPDTEDKPDPRRERSRQRWQEMKSREREARNEAQYWKSLAQQRFQEAQQPLDQMQFNSDAEYQAALAAQAMRRVSAQDHMAQAERVQAQAAHATQQAMQAQAEGLRDRVQDIDIIYAKPSQGGPMINDAMAAAIHESDSGALIAYHLAKHPAEAARIYDLSPIAAAREIGKIEAKLSLPQRRLSQAPQPVQTVSGGSGVNSVDPGKMSFKEYEKYRMAGGG